jgi:short-subunit dehydrogenase
MTNKNTVLVTGASSGIGKETVKLLLEKGFSVYAAARRLEQMEDLKEAGAKTVYLDISREESIEEFLSGIAAQGDTVDVLVNNAGYGLYGSVEETSLKDAKKQFDVNLFGLAKLTQGVLPSMREKRQGRIINITSVGGKIYTPLGAWYHASKHAVEGFSDCLRLETAAFGLSVIVIEPGPIRTPWVDIAKSTAEEGSGTGPYAKMTARVNKTVSKMYSGNSISGPEAVAKTIVRAIQSSKPKTRYSSGKMAGILLTMRHLLSDRVFDRLVKRIYGF